ncbi:hypothetical protein Rsub_06888 [Raphidocelis subcapitata]|uniref:N-acetyl-D-glucosamine kinase n=1 Tax=Raphidocelis subcapitata TaxID=307507 RepID=A0A2V0P2S9_9CHLO|nr:hypothetical protein Rsub_06888 [Raphidocelis subcapitata]|eukprot:GBF93889.1 hypothetical protein Rsub_06888 [Raphidocelis subcapitata]
MGANVDTATGAVMASAKGPEIRWYTATGAGPAADALWAVVDAALAEAGRAYADVAAACARKTAGPDIRWYTATGAGPAADALWAVVDAALAEAGRAYADVAAACACVAVRDAGADLADVQGALSKRLQGAVVVAQPDAAAALAAATNGVLQGAAVVADLHSEAVAFAGGRMHRASGWGPAFLEGGSALDLGTRALLAANKTHDGRGAPTALLHALLRRLSLPRPEELVRWAYFPEEGREARISQLAGTVLDCALGGDVVADAVLRHCCGELVSSCKAAASAVRLGSDKPFTVVLAGSLLQDGGLYAQYLAEGIEWALPGARLTYPQIEPSEGAALLARRRLQG